MVITPTMNNASGTWTLSKEHERMIQSTQRKMLRLLIQTKRKYKKKTQDKNEKKVKGHVRRKGEEEQENHVSSEDETDDGNSSNTDPTSPLNTILMKKFTQKKLKKKNGFEYMKRSTDEAMEWMKTAEIQCWIKTHRRMKWRLAMRMDDIFIRRKMGDESRSMEP